MKTFETFRKQNTKLFEELQSGHDLNMVEIASLAYEDAELAESEHDEYDEPRELKGWMSPKGNVHLVLPGNLHSEDPHPEIQHLFKKRPYSPEEHREYLDTAKKRGYARFGHWGSQHYIQYDKRAPEGRKAAMHALRYMKPGSGSHIAVGDSPKPDDEKWYTSQADAAHHIMNEGESEDKVQNESEGVPANNVGSGAIAGAGVGPQGEPGVPRRNKVPLVGPPPVDPRMFQAKIFTRSKPKLTTVEQIQQEAFWCVMRGQESGTVTEEKKRIPNEDGYGRVVSLIHHDQHGPFSHLGYGTHYKILHKHPDLLYDYLDRYNNDHLHRAYANVDPEYKSVEIRHYGAPKSGVAKKLEDHLKQHYRLPRSSKVSHVDLHNDREDLNIEEDLLRR